MTVVVELSAIRGAVLCALQNGIVHEPHRAATGGEGLEGCVKLTSITGA